MVLLVSVSVARYYKEKNYRGALYGEEESTSQKKVLLMLWT